MADFSSCERVICIKSHSQAHINGVKKGKIFSVRSHIKSPCECKVGMLDIGIDIPGFHLGWKCDNCFRPFDAKNVSIWWFKDSLFAPIIEEDPGTLTIEEILQEELCGQY